MAFVNAIGAAGTSSAVDMTGATLFVAVSTVDGSGTPNAPSDSQGNTGWVALGGPVGGTNPPFFKSRLFYKENPSVSATQTFTFGGTNGSGCVIGFSGMVASAMFDLEASGGGAATSGVESATGGSVTPSVADSVVISAGGFENVRTLSVGSGFTIGYQQNHVGGISYGSFIGYKILTASAAQNPAWSCTGQGNTNFVVLNAAFKAAVSFVGNPYYAYAQMRD